MPIKDPPRLHGLNIVGHPYLHPCQHCGHDFGGRELLRRHRAKRSPNKVCRTPEEMMSYYGWWMDRFGRWHQRHAHRRYAP